MGRYLTAAFPLFLSLALATHQSARAESTLRAAFTLGLIGVSLALGAGAYVA
jgi:hypothetical protein